MVLVKQQPANLKINCDVGEIEELWHVHQELIPLVDQVNVSCGAHAGSEGLIMKTLAYAQQYGVEVGAHPGYPDVENFGRKSMNLTENQLLHTLESQLRGFLEKCNSMGIKVAYVKPHGALYHDCKLPKVRNALNMALKNTGLEVPLMHLDSSLGFINCIKEAFLDRRYKSQNSLVSRLESGALLSENQAFSQYVSLSARQEVELANGATIKINVQSACIHGDTKYCLSLLQKIKEYRNT